MVIAKKWNENAAALAVARCWFGAVTPGRWVNKLGTNGNVANIAEIFIVMATVRNWNIFVKKQECKSQQQISNK